MNAPKLLKTPNPQLLDQISTHWTQLQEPTKVLLRYGSAVQQYLNALLPDSHEAEEVSQTFLLSVLQRGFPEADPKRGRFRDYLKICVRNAALDYLRQHRPMLQCDMTWLETSRHSDDQSWLAKWRTCLLDRTWRALEHFEQNSRGSLAYTVLQVVGEYPNEDSQNLARRVNHQTGQSLRADAFRKQVSRARKKFAQLLIAEVKKTLHRPDAESVREELAELGLMTYVGEYLDE